MAETKPTGSERAISFVLLAAGLSVTTIGLLDLLGWWLDKPILTMWKAGSNQMEPSTAVLFVMYGAALGLGARPPQSRVAVSVVTLFAVAGFTAALLLLALRLLGVYFPAELLGMHVTGMFAEAPVGYISLITLPFLTLSYGSLLASLPYGSRHNSWRGWLILSLRSLVSLVSFILVSAHIFGLPIIFGKTTIYFAFSTCIGLLIMGLAQLVLAIRDIEPLRIFSDSNVNGVGVHHCEYAVPAWLGHVRIWVCMHLQQRQSRQSCLAMSHPAGTPSSRRWNDPQHKYACYRRWHAV